MQIKIDECLPLEIIETLNNIGHKAESVKDEGLTGTILKQKSEIPATRFNAKIFHARC